MSSDPDPLAPARSIGDRLVAWQAPSGRPDWSRCPFASRDASRGAASGRSASALARVLYLLYERTQEPAYKLAADRYAIFAFASPRNPVAPFDDFRRTVASRRSFDEPAPHTGAAYQFGNALSAYADFCRHNPDEHAFSARADALFEWLQQRRTDRGYAYEAGYRASGVSGTDWIFVDDLQLVGTGLTAFYQVTARQEVLDAALRLGDHFLRPHVPGAPDGAFVESLGTWCISPLPAARGGVEFLTRLHAALPAGHPRVGLMRDRCTSSVRWQFGCQFEDGGTGMYGQDERWLGMTAAAVLAYDDIRRADWVDAGLAAELDPRARIAHHWLLENSTEECIDRGGYYAITGRSSRSPMGRSPEDVLRMLAWTIEALLRFEERAPVQ